MYYKIVEKFGPEKQDMWVSYNEWRGLHLTKFDSLDGILRPNLFEPELQIDWDNCVNEDYMINFITNLEYAKSILNRYRKAVIVGVEIGVDETYAIKSGFLGFDIIDGYGDISLLTNWGNAHDDLFDEYIMTNGLLRNLEQAIYFKNKLRNDFPNDSHAEDCDIWAIYEVI